VNYHYCDTELIVLLLVYIIDNYYLLLSVCPFCALTL